tara:strand:- start:10336 stop:10689 length:354 start_codon:yes stop_codon:yes gene_type:complete
MAKMKSANPKPMKGLRRRSKSDRPNAQPKKSAEESQKYLNELRSSAAEGLGVDPKLLDNFSKEELLVLPKAMMLLRNIRENTRDNPPAMTPPKAPPQMPPDDLPPRMPMRREKMQRI